MKKLLLTLSLLLSLGLSVSVVAAQVEAPDIDDIDVGADVEGLESIYDRTYSMDIEAMFASPDADFEDIDTSSFMRMISIQGMTFDSEDSANAYLDEMKSQLEQGLEEDPDSFSDVVIGDLEGMDAEGLTLSMDMADLEVGASVIFVVDGHQVFQIMVMDSDVASAETLATDITQFVLDAEVETEEVSFSEDGTSTGGVFDRMPSGDDEIVGDLTSVIDSELFVGDE